jgi:predicted aspartyl protease
MLPALLLLAAPVRAQEAPPMPEPAAEPVDPLAIGEEDLRMTVPVSIAGGPPWPFVIDTGAQRTVVSAELAQRLGLAPGPSRRVTTMAGTAPAATALVPGLRVGKLASEPIEAPVFARAHLGAIGMLGIDAVQGQRIRIDFARGTMTLSPSKKRVRRVAMPDEIVVVARSLYGQLIVTDARWRGRKVAVVIDTGSPVTIGNTALLRLAKTPPKALGPVRLYAATGQAIDATGYLLDRLEVGDIGFAGVPVAVADVAPFRRFGLVDRPALLLGMDALRLFRSVEIDFANRTIRFALPQAAAMAR